MFGWVGDVVMICYLELARGGKSWKVGVKDT